MAIVIRNAVLRNVSTTVETAPSKERTHGRTVTDKTAGSASTTRSVIPNVQRPSAYMITSTVEAERNAAATQSMQSTAVTIMAMAVVIKDAILRNVDGTVWTVLEVGMENS